MSRPRSTGGHRAVRRPCGEWDVREVTGDDGAELLEPGGASPASCYFPAVAFMAPGCARIVMLFVPPRPDRDHSAAVPMEYPGDLARPAIDLDHFNVARVDLRKYLNYGLLVARRYSSLGATAASAQLYAAAAS